MEWLPERRFWEDVSHPVLGHYTAQACQHRFVPGLPVTDPREKSGSA